MTKAIATMTAALLVLSPPALGQSAAEFAQQFLDNCAAEWPGNPAQQTACFERNINGMAEWNDMLGPSPFPNHVAEIGRKCLNDSPGAVAGYNWPKVADCTRRQLDAHSSL